ncbi:MAG: hypothetical protein AAGF92_16580 [Myxococcota bacterium]
MTDAREPDTDDARASVDTPKVMTVKRVGIASVARFVGVTYGVVGLLVGLGMAVGAVTFGGDDDPATGFGSAAVYLFALPFGYAAVGLVSGAALAAVYNWIGQRFGGIELEIE